MHPQLLFLNSEADITFVPLRPDKTKSFFVKCFGFPSSITVVEGKKEGHFSSTVFFSDIKHCSILWGFLDLCFIFEGFSDEGDNCLKHARAFFSENQVYPTQKDNKLIFTIERNLFLSLIKRLM